MLRYFFLIIATLVIACEAISHANDYSTSSAIAAPDTCGAGTLLCNGNCVLQDTTNCSACGAGCTSGQVCSVSTVAGIGGTCGSECTGGTTLCGGACVDTDTDPKNCGQCGGPADAGVACNFCVDGTCLAECDAPSIACGDQCIDLASDPNNCGGCNTKCSGSTPLCDKSRCVASCGGGESPCNGGCSDYTEDPKNCGGCTTGKDAHSFACPTPVGGVAACVASKCYVACNDPGFEYCVTAGIPYCVNTEINQNNCGYCGHVCPNKVGGLNATQEECVAGACVGQ